MALIADPKANVMKKDSTEKADDLMHLALLGGLGFFLGRHFFKKLGGQPPVDGGEPSQPESVPKGASYNDKVRVLQKALKVGDDGIAGKQTNGALENLYSKDGVSKSVDASLSSNYPNLNSNGFGVVSSANVDKYINAIAKNDYPLFLFNKNRGTLQDGNSVISAYKKGGYIRVKGVKTFRGVTKDNARSVWITTGKNYTYSNGETFVSPAIASRSYVSIIEKVNSGNLIIRVVTLTSTYWLSVPPSDIYVS
jgi:hypothetical protein